MDDVRQSAAPRWDLFCRVVDNLGDAGVTWRLARELAAEHGLAVTVRIDRLEALAPLVPGLHLDAEDQCIERVRVRSWPQPGEILTPAAVVLEMFGGGLPAEYVAAMEALPRPPEWFVVEYLSAEPWIDTMHGLPSPPPRGSLRRRFWFPGFTGASGGLLREASLERRRAAFTPEHRARFLAALGATAAADAALVSLFCYPFAPVEDFLDALASCGRAVEVLAPAGVAREAIERWSRGEVGMDRGSTRRGDVLLRRIPFLPQMRYDELLWSCDVNFVRGEDSFVRAQWAAQPFVWHIYAQAESAHHRKLEAFLDRYLEGLDQTDAEVVRALFGAWNEVPGTLPLADALGAFMSRRDRLTRQARDWAKHLAALPELAAGLVRAAQNRV